MVDIEEQENRTLGPEMTSEGWIVVGDDAIMWIHHPTRRCIELHPAPRKQCRVPCWGPEPTNPYAPGYFIACRVHNDDGDPLYGDGFWVESYARALRLARQIRVDILAETPSQQRARQQEFERRRSEVWLEIVALSRNNPSARRPSANAPSEPQKG